VSKFKRSAAHSSNSVFNWAPLTIVLRRNKKFGVRGEMKQRKVSREKKKRVNIVR